MWKREQKTIQEWAQADANFRPDEDALDFLALKRIVGKHVVITDENQSQFTKEFCNMIEENIDLLQKKADNFSFIKKFNLESKVEPLPD